MTAAPQQGAAVADRFRPVEAGAPVVAIHFLNDVTAFVLAAEALLAVAPDGSRKRVPLHGGGILAAAGDGSRVVTGGDDGRIVVTGAAGEPREVVRDDKQRWIDQVAAGPGNAVAWSAGRTAFVLNEKGEQRSLDLPSSAGGLAFAPKGFRLAIAHYGGVTLWFPNARAAPESLAWKGSHLSVSFSPDGKYIVTTMQEPMLHGWRLADGKHMQMSGYPGKVRSLAWAADGEWLATAGADQLVMWPFAGKDGPLGKTPRMLAPRDKRVVTVACHPVQGVAAVGYVDGLVLLVRLSDGAEILVRAPQGTAVSALAFSRRGERLAFGTEGGEAGVLAL